MKKILLLLSIIITSISLISCTNKNTKTNELSIDYVNDIFSNPNVKTLEFVNVPNEAIEIGHFAEQKILLKATYIDSSIKYMHVTESLFSKDELEQFLTPGQKHFDFLYKGNHIALKFSLKEAKLPTFYTVTYVNRFGDVLYNDTVKYLSKSSYTPKTNLDYIENGIYYRFDGLWNQDLDYIYSNIVVSPKYTLCEVENNFDNHFGIVGYETVAKKSNNLEHSMLLYLGRCEKVVLDEFDIIERKNYINENLSFDIVTKDKENLYKYFMNNITTSLLKNYIHDSTHDYYEAVLQNTYKLDFNNLNYNDNESLFINDFNDLGYDEFNTKTYYIKEISLNNILDFNDSTIYDLYNSGGNKIYITMDYPLGNYRMTFTSDIDIYINVTYTDLNYDYPIKYYQINDVKIGFSYVKNSIKFNQSYSKAEFYTYGNNFTISNYVLASGLYFGLR